MAPEFGDEAVTLPLNAILDWTMGTPAGFAAFRDPRINAILKKILGAWCEFLSSPDSRYVLNASPSGWKSPEAQRAVGMEQFEHDPDEQYWGFASWNDFFTRRFKDGARPVDCADDDQRRCPAAGSLLDQEPAVFPSGHAGRRRGRRRLCRRHGLSGVPERDRLPPLA
jgi:phosphatidylserine decarboxylase